MRDLFANNAVTTLSAAITSTTATSLSVVSSTGFSVPASGSTQFRIAIDSEILIVTLIAGTAWTIQRGAEGTTAAAHQSGATVYQVLTSGALASGFVGTSNYLGNLYSKSSWSSTSDFTSSGSIAATITLSGNAISLTPASAGQLTCTVDVGNILGNASYFTALNKWLMQAVITLPAAITTTTYGFGIGPRSVASYAGNVQSAIGRADLSSNANAGIPIFSDYQNGTKTDFNGIAGIIFSANNQVSLSLERNEDTFTVTVANLTTKSAPISYSYQFSENPSSTLYIPNTSHFCLWLFGGTYLLNSLTISSNVLAEPDLCIMGDSIGVGQFAGPYSQAFATLLSNNFRTANLSAGADTTQDMLNRLPEVLATQPKLVLMYHVAANDIRSGVATATWQANYASIVNQLTAAGAVVWHYTGYESSSGSLGLSPSQLSTLITFVSSSYTNFIPSTLGNYAGTYSNVLCADGAHPNNLGHSIIYKDLLHAFDFLNPQNVPYVLKNLENNLPQTTAGTTSGFTAGSGTAVLSGSTSTGGVGTTGYTLGDVILAMKNSGQLLM